MATPSANWSEIATTSFYNYSKTIADNVTKKTALLGRMNEKGNIKPFHGGIAIVQAMDYSENGTFGYYTGYDPLNVTPSDTFTSAQFPIAQAAVTVSMSGLEQLQNSGDSQIHDLWAHRLQNGAKTMKNNIGSGLYSDGTGWNGKQIGGLNLLVAAVPDSGTIGTIDAGVWAFWRNSVKSFATEGLVAGPATMQTMMNRLYSTLSMNGEQPDFIPADNIYFNYYLEALTAIQRITSESKAMAGYMSLKYMNADVIADGGFQGNAAGHTLPLGGGGSWTSGTGAPASSMFMLNTDYLHWRPAVGRNMEAIKGNRTSVNQDAMVNVILFAGNLTLSNRILQGRIKA